MNFRQGYRILYLTGLLFLAGSYLLSLPSVQFVDIQTTLLTASNFVFSAGIGILAAIRFWFVYRNRVFVGPHGDTTLERIGVVCAIVLLVPGIVFAAPFIALQVFSAFNVPFQARSFLLIGIGTTELLNANSIDHSQRISETTVPIGKAIVMVVGVLVAMVIFGLVIFVQGLQH